MLKVCKFGGTSAADSVALKRVKAIIESDPTRRYIVVSAPGKRHSEDIKMTDQLYAAHKCLEETGKCGESFEQVKERFREIARTIGLGNIEELLSETEQDIIREKSKDFTASRGEYLIGKLFAKFIGVPFVDARDVVRFKDGELDAEKTYSLIAAALKDLPRAVIAGYYGADDEGNVVTFTRGGADISGAIVARVVNADLFEKWTDVSGVFTSDPHKANAEHIDKLSYGEFGMDFIHPVLHSDSITPVWEAGIPVCIKNTFCPEESGTLIVKK